MKLKRSTNIILVLGFVCFIVVTFIASWRYFEKRAETDVSDGNHAEFPVVVVRPAEAIIVLINPDGGYHGKLENDSFLVPPGKEQVVNEWLRDSQKEIGAKGARELRVTAIGEERQLIELEIFGDGLFLSRYEATHKTVKPLSEKLAGPLFPFLPCSATAFIGLAGFAVLQLVLWFLRRREGTMNGGEIRG